MSAINIGRLSSCLMRPIFAKHGEAVDIMRTLETPDLHFEVTSRVTSDADGQSRTVVGFADVKGSVSAAQKIDEPHVTTMPSSEAN
jgi:hypothetical protein